MQQSVTRGMVWSHHEFHHGSVSLWSVKTCIYHEPPRTCAICTGIWVETTATISAVDNLDRLCDVKVKQPWHCRFYHVSQYMLTVVQEVFLKFLLLSDTILSSGIIFNRVHSPRMRNFLQVEREDNSYIHWYLCSPQSSWSVIAMTYPTSSAQKHREVR